MLDFRQTFTDTNILNLWMYSYLQTRKLLFYAEQIILKETKAPIQSESHVKEDLMLIPTICFIILFSFFDNEF